MLETISFNFAFQAFKINNMIHIPTEYLPVPSPLTNTRSNHNQKLIQLFARAK